MSVPKKPVKEVDSFIQSAKVKESRDAEITDTGKAHNAGVKKFLIELPYELWMNLKMRAVQEGKTLKDLILEILQDSVR